MNNMTLKGFLREVVSPSTPEDQKDSVFFEFEEWNNETFTGVPSTEVQRLVDQTIPVWLKSFTNASCFLQNFCEMQERELAIRAAAIAARYVVEKGWINKQDTRPIQAVELVEKWLENESSVTVEELNKAADRVYSSYRNSELLKVACSAYSAYGTIEMVKIYKSGKHIESEMAYTSFTAVGVTTHKEIYEVVLEKLPKFCFEDLLRWGYFSSQTRQKIFFRANSPWR